jgi:DNA-binding HxlR family transcriptional regulator
MKSQKITTKESLPLRSYEDACGAAHALDLVGERWALLVMRELLLGPKRFSDLRADLPGISANILSRRLGGLEGSGILVRRKLPPPASVHVYELTPWGYESEPIFQALGRWAARSPEHDPSLPLSAVSLLISFRTMLDQRRARAIKARVGFRIKDESFFARLADGRIEVARGVLEDMDLVFTAPAPVIAAAVYGDQPLEALEATGALTIEGNRSLAKRFVRLFPLPPQAAEST